MSEISNDIIDINDNNKLVKNRESFISSFLHQYSDWNFQRSAWDRIKFVYACIFLIIRHESSSTWMHLLQLPYRYLCWRCWVCLTTGCVWEAVYEARQEGGEDVTEIEDKMTLNYQMNPFTVEYIDGWHSRRWVTKFKNYFIISSMLLESVWESWAYSWSEYGWLHGARPEMKDYVGRTDSAFNECHGWCRAETVGDKRLESRIQSKAQLSLSSIQIFLLILLFSMKSVRVRQVQLESLRFFKISERNYTSWCWQCWAAAPARVWCWTRKRTKWESTSTAHGQLWLLVRIRDNVMLTRWWI